MFRRLSSSLPPDFSRAADLEALGYCLEEDNDQIRSIKPPHHDFNAFISKNERLNEVHTEAYHECIRQIVLARLHALGLQSRHLRGGVYDNSITTQGAPLNPTNSDISTHHSQPSIPILTSPNLHTAHRTVLYFGEKMQDLGIFAYRVIGQEAIDKGSAVDFAKSVLLHLHSQSPLDDNDKNKNEDDDKYNGRLGLAIANCGQLLWHNATGKALTETSWRAQKRESAVHDPTPVHERWNRVPCNENLAAHVASVFDFYANEIKRGKVQENRKTNSDKEGKINVIALGEGATAVCNYLNHNWGTWRDSISAIAIGDGYIWDKPYTSWNPDFRAFFASRARIYLLSKEPQNSPIDGIDNFGAPCYASGEERWTECIMPRCYERILEWFQMVEETPGYLQL